MSGDRLAMSGDGLTMSGDGLTMSGDGLTMSGDGLTMHGQKPAHPELVEGPASSLAYSLCMARTLARSSSDSHFRKLILSVP